MFTRKVRNRSGNTEIQVVKKVGRVNRIIKHIGTARTPLEISELITSAQQFIDSERIKSGIISLFDTRYKQSELVEFLRRLTFTHVLDTFTYRFLSHFYHLIGFSSLKDNCFADLVTARILEPVSKRKTRDVLEFRFGKIYSLTGIYRTLRLSFRDNYQEKVEGIIKDFLSKDLKMNIAVLFFDVTTLYFEAFDEDDTRKFGFSKEHKANQPQVVVALTVTTSGIPLAMKMFEGSTFEGHTMLPCIEEVMKRFSLQDIVVVADSAMLSRDNLKLLEEKHIQYIVGARLGNSNDTLFAKVTAAPKKDGASIRIDIGSDRILVVSYSEKRAKKDHHDREKQIKKATKMLSKPSLVVRRYKFIESPGKGKYRLNEKLVNKAEQLEGIKGYVTNATKLTNDEIIDKYTELWMVEKSFRMSKSDLKARPIFHTLKESIEAHLLIVFTALVISRYIEMIAHRSIAKVIAILSQVKEVIVEHNVSGERASQYANLTEEAKQLAKLADIDWVT